MSNPTKRMSNPVSATQSASSKAPHGSAKRVIGLKSRLLTMSRSSAAAKASGVMSKVIVAALLGLLLFVLVAPHFGFVFLTVMGDSMSPALPAGSVAVVQPTAASEVKVGDIIAYRSSGERSLMVTHRVAEVLGQEGSLSFQTGGDRNEEPDRYQVSSSSLVGRVWFHVPFVGFVLDFVRHPLGYGLLVGLPAIAVIVVLVRGIGEQTGSSKARDRQGAR